MKSKTGQKANDEGEELHIWTDHLKDSFAIETTEDMRFWETEAWRTAEEMQNKRYNGPREDDKREEEVMKILEANRNTYIQQAVSKLKENESVLFGEFKKEEITKAITKIDRNKAAGRDKVPNEAWKAMRETKMIDLLTCIFNCMLTTSNIPASWKRGIVVFLYKKGDPGIPENHRPITLLDTCFKILTVVISARLTMMHKLLTDERQLGFKPQSSVTEAVHLARINIKKGVEKLGQSLKEMKRRRKEKLWESGERTDRLKNMNEKTVESAEQTEAQANNRESTKQEGNAERQTEGEIEEDEIEKAYKEDRKEEEEIMVFFDVKKAFDRVDRSKICKEMMMKGVDLQWVKLINSSLKDTTIQAKANGMLGMVVNSNTGVFQGSPISTILFTCLYDKAYRDMEALLTKWKVEEDGLKQFKEEEMKRVFPEKKVEDARLKDPKEAGRRLVKADIRQKLDHYINKHTEIALKRGVKFADDLLLKCLLNDVNKLMTAVIHCCSNLGLEMSWKKTIILRLNRNEKDGDNEHALKLASDYSDVRVVSNKTGPSTENSTVKYLGVALGTSSSQRRQVEVRIQVAENAWRKMRHSIFQEESIPIACRLKLWGALIKCILPYGLTPELDEREILMLESFQMKCLRYILLGKHQTFGNAEDHISNRVLRERWGIPTVKSVINRLYTNEVVRWKCNMSLAYINDQEYVDEYIEKLEKEWERHKTCWRKAAEIWKQTEEKQKQGQMEVQELDYCYGKDKEKMLSYFTSGRKFTEVSWCKKECRGRHTKVLLEQKLTNKVGATLSKKQEDEATKEADIYGEEYIRESYQCRSCQKNMKSKASFYGHLSENATCFNYYLLADKQGYDCKHKCGGWSWDLEDLQKHEVFLCKREESNEGRRKFEIGKIDRREPGKLWLPRESKTWSKLNIEFIEDRGIWKCKECNVTVPASASRNILIHASKAHNRGNEKWKEMEQAEKNERRLLHESRIVEDMERRAIDVEKAYRWSELHEELKLKLESERVMDPRGKKRMRKEANISIEEKANLIAWEESTGKWRCMSCEEEGRMARCRRFEDIGSITQHHTKIHCDIRNQRVFYCPYCLSTNQSFSGLKNHIAKGNCKVVKMEEVNDMTWYDIILVNKTTTRDCKEEMEGGRGKKTLQTKHAKINSKKGYTGPKICLVLG